MRNALSYLGRSARCWLLGLTAVVAGTIFIFDTAKADTPEYWGRETFSSERSKLSAALSTYDDDEMATSRPAPRRAVRASLTRPEPDPVAAKSRQTRRSARKAREKNVRVASLGNSFVPAEKPQRSVSGGGGIRWVAKSSCLNGSLRGVIAQVAARFGSVTVNSTCRSRRHNARVGGASRSMHLTGNAADFRVHGSWGAASSFIRSLVGGFKHYGGGLFHIDTGTRRTW